MKHTDMPEVIERRQPMTADDPLRAFKAMMIWIPVCIVLWVVILILV